LSNTANEPAATEANKKQLVRLASALALFWFLASGFGLWYFFNRDVTSFIPAVKGEPSYTSQNYETYLDQIKWPKTDGLTFIHFIDENCSCTRFSLEHINDLQDLYSESEHILVRNTGSTDKYSGVAISSPSVAVVNAQGELAYYGPYTDGATCQQGKDLVELVVNGIERDAAFEWLNLLSSGCFCAWPDRQAIHF
jgi:Domain of unknown function (DUF6436)